MTSFDPLALVRQNLAALGVTPAGEELEQARAEGFLATALAFHQLATGELAVEDLPDLLRDRTPLPAEIPSLPGSGPDELPDILALASRLRRGETTSRQLVEQALQRITSEDSTLNAFQLVLADQALAAAETADAELARGIDRGPLHGLPVALKDLVDVAGVSTTAGSTVLARRIAQRDATVVERLRAAGAIIVGKTRLPEFAYAGSSTNPHYGPVRNPRAPAYDTGGSSSGSAAAVGAGMVVMAIGSDTGGSIRIPATYCGLVGLKPTFGRVSLAGVFPLAWSLDHLGPITRTVADAAVSLAAIAGPDARDPRTRPAPLPDLLAAARAERLPVRVAVLCSSGGEPLADPEVRETLEPALDCLAQAGATLLPLDLPELAELRVLSAAIAQLEIAALHGPLAREWWSRYGDFFRLRLLGCFAYPNWASVVAQRLAARARDRFAANLAEHGCELLALPTTPNTAPRLGQWSPRSSWLTSPFNLLGWPAISVPAGIAANGLPVGIQLVAGPWREDLVVAAASIVERTQPGRRSA
ncbi:amidase [Thermomicrobium sp. 4228-Ro]|uniref:amidase n=1 Tax=Thermomicrobium sp. 4228-Ro TaxID=2993937 RepID=UPI002248FEEC|nr:amidase [Thermomicrobium sp. 4228-Ro]MCX2726548.1 amidase [Thermomicrobium sp. 4228-Ro]